MASPGSLASYPLPAFHFKVMFVGLSDTSFQEVNGIGSEIETEDVTEGGENHFVHRLPKAVKHPQLELKRGITSSVSPLVLWCKAALELGFSVPIAPTQVIVHLLNENGDPVRSWAFANAYPVKWEIGQFNSTKNDIVIETMMLSYTHCIMI